MSDITITCPSCDQELEVPQELLGQVVDCPACEQSIQLPAPAPANTARKKVVVKTRRPASSSRPATRGPAAQPQQKGMPPGQVAAVVVIVIVLIVAGTVINGGLGWLSPSSASSSPPPRSTHPAPRPAPAKTWYSGGTLHSATMAEWRTASYENRLATSADFVTKMMQIDGETIPPVDQLRPRAYGLEKAISAANPDGLADNQDVATVAATCWVLMKQM